MGFDTYITMNLTIFWLLFHFLHLDNTFLQLRLTTIFWLCRNHEDPFILLVAQDPLDPQAFQDYQAPKDTQDPQDPQVLQDRQAYQDPQDISYKVALYSFIGERYRSITKLLLSQLNTFKTLTAEDPDY